MRLLRPTAASCVTVSGTLSIGGTCTSRYTHRSEVGPSPTRSFHASANSRRAFQQYLAYLYLPVHERMFHISRRFHWKTAPKISHRQFSSSRYASKMDLPRPLLLEEETLDCYSPDQFYPVAVGEVLNSSYKVVAKLGYGAQSTVWLCRDVRYDC